MITVNSLTYRYPNSTRNALRNVSMHVESGEFIILAGPSGSGKSTLMRSINGLVPHFSGGVIEGKVIVNDIDVIKAGPTILSQFAGFVTQNPESQALLDRVEPEIAFALENSAVPEQEMRVRVEEVLDLMDLTPLRDRSISSLSGGERQRVAIAAVLALRPHILLLDEPTSQLDPKSAEDVLRSLVRLNEDLGLTIIIAEHRLERVLRYGDRLVYMEDGQIIIDDSVRMALPKLPQVPPIIELGRQMGWTPLPLTVKEGRRFASQISETPNALSNGMVANKNDTFIGGKFILTATNVHFAYNSAPILNGINLQVHPGEVVALMGRNGSGKSTFLKCIIGLLKFTHGTILINGLSVAGQEIADIAQRVAYLPQNPDDLLFAESVYDELRITLENHKMTDRNEINRLLLDLGLGDVSDSYPRDLSTGQRQRVAMGAVTITHPDLLLLDEPTRGLDGRAKQALMTIWERWVSKGIGLLLVSHDVELVARIADRVVILSQGEIIASGSTIEVLGTSPLFAPQISRLFPEQRWLTVEDALTNLKEQKWEDISKHPPKL